MPNTKKALSSLREYEIHRKVGLLIPIKKQDNPISKLLRNLPEEIKSKNIREKIENLPTLDITEENALFNLSALTFLAQAYMLGSSPDDTKDRKNYLPQNIATPLDKAAQILGVMPGMTYLPFVLTHKGVGGSFSGSKGEFHFVRIHMAIEVAGATALRAIHRILSDSSPEQKKQALERMAKSLSAMAELMTKMPNNLTPDEFMKGFRKFLIGSEVLPGGLTFNGTSREPVKMAGGSGMQSPLFPILDAFLGVQHTQPAIRKLLDGAEQAYLPGHKQFLDAVRTRSKQNISTLNKAGLNSNFRSALAAMVKFRQAHLDTVTKYIGNNVGTGGSGGAIMLQEMLKNTQNQNDICKKINPQSKL